MTGPDSGGEARRPPIPPPNPLLMATVDDSPAVPLNTPAPTVPDHAGLREVIHQTVYDLAVDHPMWIDDKGRPLDYTPEREVRIGDFLDAAADALLSDPFAALMAERDEARASARTAWGVHAEHVDRMNALLLQAQAVRDEARRERDELAAKVAAVRGLARSYARAGEQHVADNFRRALGDPRTEGAAE